VIDQIQDPVCGRMVVPRANKKLRYAYAEVIYYFDRRECLDRFAEQPEVFLSQLGQGGKNASFDRALRPELFQHRGELNPNTPHTLEQPRVESGSG
jgi:YHS domain-containing protein